MAIDHDLSTGKCPMGARRNAAPGHPTNADWWPNQLNLKYPTPSVPPVRSYGQGVQLC